MSDSKEKTVLLVEDLEENRRVIRLLARRMGVKLFEAVDGQEGLEIAHRELPDVILMDLSLPILDGWTATTRLKADPATGGIPIIALTAHAMSEDRERALAAGCDDFDTKPIEFPRLIGKVDALLGVST